MTSCLVRRFVHCTLRERERRHIRARPRPGKPKWVPPVHAAATVVVTKTITVFLVGIRSMKIPPAVSLFGHAAETTQDGDILASPEDGFASGY